MKSYITISLLFIMTIFSYAQSGEKNKRFYDYVELIPSTITVFVMTKEHTKEEYIDMLSKVWTVSPFIVVYADEYDIKKYANYRYSIMRLGITNYDSQVQSYSYKISHFFYELITFADYEVPPNNIEYYINNNYIRNVGSFPIFSHDSGLSLRLYEPLRKQNSERYWCDLYHPEYYHNFELFQLMIRFKEMNFFIINKTKLDYYLPIKLSKKNSRLLESDTLFISEEIPFLFHKKYKYPYSIISKDELAKKILRGDKIRYLRVDKLRPIGEGLSASIVDSETGLHILNLSCNRNKFYSEILEKISKKIHRKL